MTCNQNCEQGRRCGCVKSDTPKTDAEEANQQKEYELAREIDWPSFDAVCDFDLCRTLERELAEQCRLLSMGSERETRLMAKAAELEKQLRWIYSFLSETPDGCLGVNGIDGKEVIKRIPIVERLLKEGA